MNTFKTRWTNENGGEWFGDPAGYATIDDAWVTAQTYFDDPECVDDIVQVWEVDEDGEIVGVTAVEEYSADDFTK